MDDLTRLGELFSVTYSLGPRIWSRIMGKQMGFGYLTYEDATSVLLQTVPQRHWGFWMFHETKFVFCLIHIQVNMERLNSLAL